MRKVRTASGATAVQIAVKEDGVRRIVEHLGSAHDETEVAALLEVGRQKIAAWQGQGLLDLESLEPAAGRTGLASTTVESKRSGLLWDVLHGVCTRLGLGDATGGDRAFEQMIAARLIEPTSKAQVPRVLGDLGLESVSVRTLFRSLGRCGQRGYRQAICQALFDHVTASGGLALCLYDVTTLYFEAEREDDLRRVGYSKERRVDPQIIVGLLVDRAGFPSRSAAGRGTRPRPPRSSPSWRPSRPPTASRSSPVVADAGMLSAANLAALDDARLRFIVGARQVRAPGDLEAHFHWEGDAPADGQLIGTITPRRGSRSERDKSRKAEPVWDPHTHPGSWRAVWSYSKKRAARDNQTLTAQEGRARAVIAGEKRPKGTRFARRPRR